MMMTLNDIGELIGGVVSGDPQIAITGIASIENAGPGDITFAKDGKWIASLYASQASAVVISKDTNAQVLESISIGCVLVENVESAFSKVACKYRPSVERPSIGISPQAFVSPSATIGDNVNIYPGAYVGDYSTIGPGSNIFPGVCILEQCEIGRDVTIFPNAVLYERTKVGDQSIIHSGAVLGAYGFGYESTHNGHRLLDQLGNTELGQSVEIGAGTTVDRGTFGATRVDDGCKFDNQVMIGHNCDIGKHNLFCSQVGVAGSCRTGEFVVMAGHVGIGDHISIGDNVTLGAKSGVMHDLASGKTYLGAPAIEARDEFQLIALRAKLPQLRKQLKQLEKRIAELTQRLDQQPCDTQIERSPKAA